MTDFKDLRLVWLEAFVRVADSGKRTAAAAEMGIHQGTVTKHIQKLEEWLGGSDSPPSRRLLIDDNGKLYPGRQEFLLAAQEVLQLLKEARKLPEPVEKPPKPRISASDLRPPFGKPAIKK